MATFHPLLDRLVEAYRVRPFSFWKSQYEGRREIHDSADGNPDAANWWQADTAVLEIEATHDGRFYALVDITLYPPGIHSFPPAPNAGFKVYEDGVVEGRLAGGVEFKLTPIDIASMPPNTSLERTREA